MGRSSSSSEDEHMLLRSEIEKLPLQQNERQKLKTTLNWRLFLILAAFNATVSILASLLMWTILRSGFEHASNTRKSLLPGLDIPSLGSLEKPFMPERLYNDPRTEDGHEAWMNLFPRGKGYVSLDNIKAAGPIPDFVTDTATDGSGKRSIAVFHQLHCLYLISSDLYEALDGNLTAPHSHTGHCLDYIRQSILCSSDNTLEPFKAKFDTTVHRIGVDGYGTPHQCRDFSQLHAWAERFRYNDDRGFDRFEG